MGPIRLDASRAAALIIAERSSPSPTLHRFAMFVTSLFLVLTSLATQSVLAQNPTRAEISACWDSMYATNLPETLYLDPNDNTHFFNVSHAYDPALCTTRIPVVEFRLVNRVTQSVEMCPVKQFDGSGVLDLSCSTTL